jgi:hypothetical protein
VLCGKSSQAILVQADFCSIRSRLKRVEILSIQVAGNSNLRTIRIGSR